MSDDLLSLFDSAPLNRRFWVTFTLMSAVTLLDFFDFFLIAFVMSVIGREWHLTYGQGALILYGAGIGAIIGSLVWGSLGDLFGRKMQTVSGTLICGVSAGLIGLLPTGAWVPLAVLRFIVGFGLAASVTPALTMVVELTPTRWRTGMTSFFIVFASAGTLLASSISAVLLQAFGWRGVAMTGFIAAVVGLLIWAFVPESVRWLTAKGRFTEARVEVARHLRVPLANVPLPSARPLAPPRARLSELFSVNPRLFWQTIVLWGGSATAAYGYYLWGPTIVALALHVGPAAAAKYFILVAGTGVIGKIIVSLIAPKMGRRSLGILFGFVAFIFLGLAGYFSGVLVGGFPLFVILVAASAFFVEGGFSNLAPYTVEQYGVSLGARSSGLGQAANGVGKILGPLALALLAGSGNVIAPKATAEAVLPAFLFMAGMMLAVALAYVFLGVETHGRAMALGPGQAPREPARACSRPKPGELAAVRRPR
ncbi:MAG: MFS transporter [Alphaproteobacteria bacterium]|nr:MFS transporter [Alphaproteobacteria bacterium]